MKIKSTPTSVMHHPTPCPSRSLGERDSHSTNPTPQIGCWRFPSPNLSALRGATLRSLAGLVLALLAGGPGLASAQSGIPSIINYQGKLTDDLGNPVPAGSYEVTFKIWNGLSTTLPSDYIWGRTLPVHVVTNGLFNVLLTDGTPEGSPRTDSLLNAFDGDQRYLGLTITKTPGYTVPSPSEISPRQRLVSAPFAIHSASAYVATWAAGATNAGLAGTADYANYATNAGKFCNYTTNDFLLVNKTAQTLNGSLTLKSNLIVSGNVGIGTTNPLYRLSFGQDAGDKISLWSPTTGGPNYGFGMASLALQIHSGDKASDVVFGYGQSPNITETVRFKGSGDIKVAGQAPIQIKTYDMGYISATDGGVMCETGYETNAWSAAVIGSTFYGDINESIKGYYGIRAVKGIVTHPSWPATNWTLVCWFPHEGGTVTNIHVDVMFMRKELVNDMRVNGLNP